MSTVEIDVNNIGEKPKEEKEKHQEWTNPIEFLMTCIGAFVIAFVSMLFIVGLPMFYLELTLAQFSKYGPLEVWKVVPLVRGIGIVSLLIAGSISLYYNVLICYSLIYVISSFLPNLPWKTCDFAWNDRLCCSTTYDINGTIVQCPLNSESPAKQYFNKFVLNKSDDIGDMGGINWKVAASLLACWLLIFLSLCKGVQSLGKVSYLTAIFPYIMIIALIVRGVTLPGAMKGIEFYILKIDINKLLRIETWLDAINQVYFCLSISQGGLYTLGRHNSFHYNHQRTSIFIVILDGFTGVLAGFAIFSVLGYMSDQTGVDVDKLAVGGPGLSFIVYPEALSLMPFPWIWCIMFFLMMVTIGFGSILSWVECVLQSSTQVLKKYINTKKKVILFRLFVCVCFFLLGLPMCTRSGIYIQNLLDTYISGYPVLVCAALESFCFGWIYGIKNIKRDLKMMLGSEPKLYWTFCFRYLTPLFTLLALILAIIAHQEASLNDYIYPAWANNIGYVIVAILLSPLIIFYQISLSKFGFKNILKPDPTWKPAIDIEDENDQLNLELNHLDGISEKNSKKNTQNVKDNLAFEIDHSEDIHF